MENLEKIKPIKLPDEIDYGFGVWLKQNNYSLRTCKEYYLYIKKLLGKDNDISIDKIKAYLSTKNCLPKQASIKLFIIFLEDMHSIKIPSFRYPRLKINTKPQENISHEQFDRLQNNIRSEFSLFLKLMYYCALRVDSCASIRTDWFNWAEWFEDTTKYGKLYLKKMKGGRMAVIPINPSLMRELYDYCPRHKESSVLKSDVPFFQIGMRYSLYKFRKKKKGYPQDVIDARYSEKVVRNFRLALTEVSNKVLGRNVKTHALRSSRASYLSSQGIQAPVIRDILTHKNIATTNRYIINTPQQIEDAFRKIDGA